MNTQIDNLLADLKKWRTQKDIASENMKSALDNFTATDDVYVNQKENMATAITQVVYFESMIRDIALVEYKENQNKKPHEKVSIKIFKTFKIVDSARVLTWVKTNLADALIYDEGKVKNYATKIGAVEGTELAEEARAQIASEL